MGRAIAWAFVVLAASASAAAQERVELRLGLGQDFVEVDDPKERLGRWIERWADEAESARLWTGTLSMVLGAGVAGASAGIIASDLFVHADPSDATHLQSFSVYALGIIGLVELAYGAVMLAVPTGHELRRTRWRAARERGELDETEQARFEGELRASVEGDTIARDLQIGAGIAAAALGGIGFGLTAWLAETQRAEQGGYWVSGVLAGTGVLLALLALIPRNEHASDLERHRRGIGPRLPVTAHVGPNGGGVGWTGTF